jgi:heterodisulfide reductase subunit A-like polyferredoxin
VITAAVIANRLEGVVLAGCACCAIDQVCTSCTFQRLRCKDNLGVFLHPTRLALGDNKGSVKIEFVNIREQCAWVHSRSPALATELASAFIASAVAKIQDDRASIPVSQPAARSAVILGSGAAAPACQAALSAQGISAQQLGNGQIVVRRSRGQYVAARLDGSSWQASAVVLAPENTEESKCLLAAFGGDRFRPRILPDRGGLETHRPGVFYCDPSFVAAAAGAAAAARVAAWLGRAGMAVQAAAVVDPARCRACATCVDICEFGAPELVGEDGQRTSWIDPQICNGCGTCAAHCPSGAIRAGYAAVDKIETMITTLLA